MLGDTEATFKNHNVGYVLGICCRVKATNTMAEDIIALWQALLFHYNQKDKRSWHLAAN